MARITLRKGLTSAIYGALDIGLEELDKIKGWTEPFKNATDIERAVVCVGGGLVNYLGIETDLSEPLFYSSLPLLEKSIYKAVRGYVKKGYTPRSASEAGYVRITPSPQVQATPVSRITSY